MRFERFKTVGGLRLAEKSEEQEANALVYCMGKEADDVLNSFGLTADQLKVYKTVKEKFETYFNVRQNTCFKRARFKMGKQEEWESADQFITSLYTLAEHCEYGTLKDELIRDRTVVGLRDAKSSEQLQLDPNLTLEKAHSRGNNVFLNYSSYVLSRLHHVAKSMLRVYNPPPPDSFKAHYQFIHENDNM